MVVSIHEFDLNDFVCVCVLGLIAGSSFCMMIFLYD